MKVIFKYDGRSYSGSSVDEIVLRLMTESHDRTMDPQRFMRLVARRVRKIYGKERVVRTSTSYRFLHDLIEVGQAHSITKVLSDE
jgi:hypothetical protein